jgi:ABC-type Mn2+/Zn2+ transport system ATPase subunit
MSSVLIEFQNASIGYRKKPVLSELSFAIFHGDLLGIVGANGSGKSTLLKAVLGILTPLHGRIKFADNKKPNFGYVPQRGQLDEIYPFTVAEIVMMGRYRKIGLYHKPQKIDHSKTEEALLHLAIDHLADTRFGDLSGGLKQRTLIARALASDPEILVLDEPTEGLDLASEFSILELITHFYQIHQLTVLLVSHRLDAIAGVCRRIGLIHQGLFQIGEKQEMINSTTLTRIYNMPVAVHQILGRTVVVPGGENA